jgi:hypothetical protein
MREAKLTVNLVWLIMSVLLVIVVLVQPVTREMFVLQMVVVPTPLHRPEEVENLMDPLALETMSVAQVIVAQDQPVIQGTSVQRMVEVQVVGLI